jgi:hypothetical protein
MRTKVNRAKVTFTELSPRHIPVKPARQQEGTETGDDTRTVKEEEGHVKSEMIRF